MSQGRVEEIYIFPNRGEEAQSVQMVKALVGNGPEGDHRRHHNRQVSLLSREVWLETTAELGVELEPAVRRANLLVSGMDLSATMWRRLRVGATAQVLIRGETTPCAIMDQAFPGLEAALEADARGGVFGRIETGGPICVGDSIDLLDEDAVAKSGLATSHGLRIP